VLREIADGEYEIISGERRWRAAKLAGLGNIPAIVKKVSDESALAMSLIENIQRENLNPLEEAYAIQRLIDEFELTHEGVARSLGKSRSAVSNSLRLINLDLQVAEMLSKGEIEMGHARALLGAQSERQLVLANIVISRSLTVRQTEELVRKDSEEKTSNPQLPKKQDADIARLESNLSQLIGQPVQLNSTGSGKGKLVIGFSSLDELDGVLKKLGYRE
jgi:ParB family chromosome partitioning protein